MKTTVAWRVALCILCVSMSEAQAQVFTLVDAQTQVQIIYDPQGPALDSIAAHLLAQDIARVSGVMPKVMTEVAQAQGQVIILGSIQSALVRGVLPDTTSFIKQLTGQWERYAIQVIANPTDHIQQACIITGSDRRGTAYGVFALSEKIGVSPWYWWADVPVAKQNPLRVAMPFTVSASPQVKYRGIFINDEDWGLQPWAAHTFEPAVGDIGPKTYARVFELLLRLKANLIWPAMHPCTHAFFYYPDNPRMAHLYGIVLGSSHAEPMLRNNVDEWHADTLGDFNYVTNADTVYAYWASRVQQSKDLEAIYTVGMRGIHDSGMHGAGNQAEAAQVLNNVITDQRQLLQTYIPRPVTTVPQAFTPYKEVLSIYDEGMDLPEDITLVWPDDNYGYIRRLSNPQEQRRAGGSGVYYHASYWGRPHDYLWLSSTHPALIREEMMKAYALQARNIWVLNVGDIKPLEYNLSLFMDMAYHPQPFQDSRYVKEHMFRWFHQIFSVQEATAIRDIIWQCDNLAFDRRPEFMGWSQTEPTTPTRLTAYQHTAYGDEAARRLAYDDYLAEQVNVLKAAMAPQKQDAFFELVYYPVMSAVYMDKKFLYHDKSVLYTAQHRLNANYYTQQAQAAYDSIVALTEVYNNTLASGKWRGIMNMRPRNLPVFNPPVAPTPAAAPTALAGISIEGMANAAAQTQALPVFDPWGPQQRFIDLYLQQPASLKWSVTPSVPWLKVSQEKGHLTEAPGAQAVRLWVHIAWDEVPAKDSLAAQLTIRIGQQRWTVNVPAFHSRVPALATYKGFIESNGYVSIYAEHFTSASADAAGVCWWQNLDGLGHTGASIQALPWQATAFETTADQPATAAMISYPVYTFTQTAPQIQVAALPTHPLNKESHVRIAVTIDHQPPQILNFETTGRSDTWKQNVLRNTAFARGTLKPLAPGPHTLKIYAIDPGVIIDYITLSMQKEFPSAYTPLAETKKSVVQTQ